MQKINIVLGLAAALLTALSSEAGARDLDFSQDTTPIPHSEHGPVSSDQILDISTSTASAMKMEGEQFMRTGNIDKAVAILGKSVEMSPSDMDGRILFAEAMEKKLVHLKTQDPQLHNAAVKQWAYIAKRADYPDQKVQALKHLSTLTGSRPRMLETEDRFLARVLLPENSPTRAATKPGPAGF